MRLIYALFLPATTTVIPASPIAANIATIIMVLLLFILGVSSIREFALPLMIGLISGTYSSIFIAAALWYVMKLHLGKDKLMKTAAAKTKKK